MKIPREQAEKIARDIYDKYPHIWDEAVYAGQVNQCEEAAIEEFVRRIADLIQSTL